MSRDDGACDTWQDVVLVNQLRASVQRTEVNKAELFTVLRVLITADGDDILRLRELDILNADATDDDSACQIARTSWMEASGYKNPKTVREALSRSPEEAAYWREAIYGEVDWFIENGKVEMYVSQPDAQDSCGGDSSEQRAAGMRSI
jgi:hypothetical protein